MSEPERCPICGGLLIDHPEMLPCPGEAMSEKMRMKAQDYLRLLAGANHFDEDRLRQECAYLADRIDAEEKARATPDPDPPPEGPK